jgi:hypothetical protein
MILVLLSSNYSDYDNFRFFNVAKCWLEEVAKESFQPQAYIITLCKVENALVDLTFQSFQSS